LEPLAEGMSCIYKLVDPLPSNIIYVGRTTQPLEIRRRAHMNGRRAPVNWWAHSLMKEGREPHIIELERIPAEQAPAAEDRWIAHFRLAGADVLNLRNGAAGGNAKRPIHQHRHFWNTTGVSGYRGVTRSGERWRAMMRHKGIYQNLGTYDTPQEAARAYDQAALALFGESATLNFPQAKVDGQNRT
jgi:hypothetical protein